MKLPFPFYRLPHRFDTARLMTELSQFKEDDWQLHPTGFKGNSAIRLISVDGGENDDFDGPMEPTPHLFRCPYMHQILAGFGVAWSRSRLMRLTPGAEVPPHSDINYHWVNRVRIHIPIQTDESVSFTCGNQTVHMAAGEAWLFDNWRQHTVTNASPRDRVHFVADTVGNAAFWQMLNSSQVAKFDQAAAIPQLRPFDSQSNAPLWCERHNVATVMPPAEIELLTSDLLRDLKPSDDPEVRQAINQFIGLTLAFSREWRSLWALFGPSKDGWTHYLQLKEWAITELKKQPAIVMCASVGLPAKDILYPRVLLYSFNPPKTNDVVTGTSTPPTVENASHAVPPFKIKQPVFIIAAPRSGSSLLFETLSQAADLWTVGGESHWLIERLPNLQPWAPGVGSNRLTAMHLDEQARMLIPELLASNLRNRDQQLFSGGEARVLEKTPKHALRVPFFNALFPDAKFIFLWRDPRENLSSIIEAWRSGGWITYPQLEGWDGPWSLLLPPDWETMRGRPLEEIAAYQWAQTNEIALDDLAQLSADRWISISYADFLNDPQASIRRLCDFAEIEFDAGLKDHLSRPLPLSSHTLSAPNPDKWQVNEALIDRVLPGLKSTAMRLAALIN